MIMGTRKMEMLLEDVNFDELVIGRDGKTLVLKFIDMNEGNPVSALKCSSVFMLNYQNTFEVDDGLACYVGEVGYSHVAENEVSEWLRRNNFSFSTSVIGGKNLNDSGLIWLHIEGGEVIVDVACQGLEHNGQLVACV